MYQDKLANFKNQLEQLKNNTHPEYIRRVRKLELQYNERLRVNTIYREFSIECVEREFITEKKAAVKEYDEKRADLKENLISDFEEKRKSIEAERYNMELTGDSTEAKPTVTRKLRRRPNDPIPMTAEKRRKPTVSQLVYQLDEKEIDNDLKMITRGKTMTPVRPPSVGSNGMSPLGPITIASSLPPTESYSMVETKIEDGKLLYERRWFHRGQPVYIEGKDLTRFAATILSIANDGVSLHKAFVGRTCFAYQIVLFLDLGQETEQQWSATRQNPDQPFIAWKSRHQTTRQLNSRKLRILYTPFTFKITNAPLESTTYIL